MPNTLNFLNIKLILVFAVLCLSACVSQHVLIGELPSEPAPRIVFLGAIDSKGQDYLTWENVPSFGRVPPEMQAIGDLSCMRTSLEMRATGYHPKAISRNGKVIPGGGFYCQPRLLAGFDQVPPRLIMKENQLGWDRPGAFGPVPQNLTDKAKTICSRQNSHSRALAYHPNALDQSGSPIPGGGFLCIE